MKDEPPPAIAFVGNPRIELPGGWILTNVCEWTHGKRVRGYCLDMTHPKVKKRWQLWLTPGGKVCKMSKPIPHVERKR